MEFNTLKRSRPSALAHAKAGNEQKRGSLRVDALRRAAADMFLENGYTALSIDALIERVGGSRRNIYAHFGGKEQLFVEAVERLCLELGEPLTRLKIDDAGIAPEQALNLFGRALIDIVLAPDTLALHRLMVAEGQRFPVLAIKIWNSGHNQARQILGNWMQRQQGLGQVRTGSDPFLLANLFVDLATADLQLRALVGLEISDGEISSVLSEAVTIFLNGWKKPPVGVL